MQPDGHRNLPQKCNHARQEIYSQLWRKEEEKLFPPNFPFFNTKKEVLEAQYSKAQLVLYKNTDVTSRQS